MNKRRRHRIHEDPKQIQADAKVFIKQGRVVGFRKRHTFKGDVSSRITVQVGDISNEVEAIEPEVIVEQDVIGQRLSAVKKEVRL